MDERGRGINEDGMQNNTGTVVNWRAFNVPSIVAVITVGVGLTMYVARLEGRVQQGEEYREMRSRSTDANFAKIDARMQMLDTMPFRVTSAEKGLEEVNKRVDRVVDLINNGFEGLRKDISALSTRQEVTASKIDELTKKVDGLNNIRPTPFQK